MAARTDNGVKLTYEEFSKLPDDGLRHEIIDGAHCASPSPSYSHQTISRWIQYQLMRQIEEPGFGVVINAPVDVELTAVDIVEPDLVVVAGSRREIIIQSRIRGVPDLLVEVLSPSNPSHDTHAKLHLYERVGVPEYWIVDGEAERLLRYVIQGTHYGTPEVRRSSIEYHRLEMHATVDLELVWSRR